MEVLETSVFPNIQHHFNDHKWLCERAILAPTNDSVNAINLHIQQKLFGERISYKSDDKVVDVDQTLQYPIEISEFPRASWDAAA